VGSHSAFAGIARRVTTSVKPGHGAIADGGTILSLTFSAARSFGGAFLITEGKIDALAELCANNSGQPPQMDLRFAEDMDISSKDISRLLKDPLARLYPVRSLTIGGHMDMIRVRVHPFLDRGEASYEIRSADTQTGPALKTRLDKEFSDMRCWYSFLYPSQSWIGLACWIMTGLIFGYGALVLWTRMLPFDEKWAVNALTVCFVTGLVCAALCNRAKRLLFPPLVFNFGKGADVARRLATTRMVLLTSVVIAVAIRFIYGKILG
jgi:hypothetical protein